MNRFLAVALGAASFLGTFEPASAQGLEPDRRLPEYAPTQGVSGSIKSVGSDTMNNLMTLWAETFIRHYSSVQVEIEGKGSSTAPAALIEGNSTFGPMSRPMKAEEIDEFERRYGYKPVAMRVGIDMLAVYVHRDNPIKSLTLAQVDAIFSTTRKGGHASDIVTWGDLGLTGEWADKRISLYGRNSASGTYGYFRKHALAGGDYKDTVKAQPGSSTVVQGVASDRYAIGYSGIGYKTADVRAVPLAIDSGSPAIEPTTENAYTGEYPLARFLLLYLNYRPGSRLDPLRREYLKYIFSIQGQRDVIKDGYYPVTWDLAKEDLESVGLTIPNPARN